MILLLPYLDDLWSADEQYNDTMQKEKLNHYSTNVKLVDTFN